MKNTEIRQVNISLQKGWKPLKQLNSNIPSPKSWLKEAGNSPSSAEEDSPAVECETVIN